MSVAEVIYRLVEYVEMSIFVRSGVDSFNIYQSTVETGPYTLVKNVANVASTQPRYKNRVKFSFNPIDLGWNNQQKNYIKIAPVTNSVEGAQEGPVVVYPMHYQKLPADYIAIQVWDETESRYIPASTDMSAFKP